MKTSQMRSIAVLLAAVAILFASPATAAASGPACSRCAGDLTETGSVDVFDLLAVLDCWGEIEPGSPCECADLTGSAGVGVGDLLALLNAWGACPGVCGAGAGECFAANTTPGCDHTECCKFVCGLDRFCCDVEWDQLCADQASSSLECGKGDPVCSEIAGMPGAECCDAHGGVGCNQFQCCECVCDLDLFCCDVEWDEICAGAVVVDCPCDCASRSP